MVVLAAASLGAPGVSLANVVSDAAEAELVEVLVLVLVAVVVGAVAGCSSGQMNLAQHSPSTTTRWQRSALSGDLGQSTSSQ